MKLTLASALFICIVFVTQSQSNWEIPTKTADSLDLLMRFESALPYRAEALELAKNEADSIKTLLQGLYLFTKAEQEFNLTRRADTAAYALMQRATDSLLAAPAPPERISKAYWDLNMAAFNYMRNREDTEKYLNKSIEYHLKSPVIDTVFLLNTMHGSGYMSTLSGNYTAAIATLKKAEDLIKEYEFKETKDQNLPGYIYSNLALIYNSGFLDIPQKERHYLEQAEAVFSKLPEPDFDYYLSALTSLSRIHREYGNYKRAEGYLNKARQVYEANKETIHQRVMHHLGIKKELDIANGKIILHRESGNEKAMLEEFKKVEQLVANNHPDAIELGMYKGIIESVVRNYTLMSPNPDLAEKFIELGLQIQSESTSNYRYYGNAGLLRSRARVKMIEKEYDRALDILISIQDPNLTTGKKILINELMALSYIGLNEPDKALNHIHAFVELLAPDNQGFNLRTSPVSDFQPGNVIGDAEALVRLAKAWRELYGKSSNEEEKLYQMAMKQFRQALGNNTLNRALKSNFDEIVHGILETALTRQFTTEQSNELLSFIETVKSRALINTFLLNRELAGNSQLYKLAENEQLIRSQLTQLKKNLQKNEDETLRQQLFDKTRELEHLQKQLTDTYREFNEFAATDFKLQDYHGKTIIKFIVAHNHLYRLTITEGSINYYKIGGYDTLVQNLSVFLTDISNPQTDKAELKFRSEQLYRQLFSGVAALDEAPIIIPDGILYYLPFELLVKNGSYLVENHSIAYAPNLTFININNFKNRTASNSPAAYFAPVYSGPLLENQPAVRGVPYALQGAQDEVNILAALLPGELFTGEAASKSRFKSLKSNTGIIHLAMHSILNDTDPELSALLFTNAESDYKMYISELYGMNFNSDLAVLSACNTGVGGFKDGGGLVSFQNAFTLAGVPATVASLWSAPDQSTREIMVSFYKHLKAGHSKSKALQLAKIEYLKNSPTSELQHPFYWAGFVLSGNDMPLSFSKPFWKRTSFLIVGSLLLVVFLLFASFSFKKRKQ